MKPLYESVKEEKSKADEMFEELGYKLTMYGKSKILYSKELDFEGICIRSIWFDKRNKRLRLYGYYNMQELQAINKKVEELGWIH